MSGQVYAPAASHLLHGAEPPLLTG